jgi:hypothetical protein
MERMNLLPPIEQQELRVQSMAELQQEDGRYHCDAEKSK